MTFFEKLKKKLTTELDFFVSFFAWRFFLYAIKYLKKLITWAHKQSLIVATSSARANKNISSCKNNWTYPWNYSISEVWNVKEKFKKLQKFFQNQPFSPELFPAKYYSLCCIFGISKHWTDVSSWLGGIWVKRNFPTRNKTVRKKWKSCPVWRTRKNQTGTKKRPMKLKIKPYLVQQRVHGVRFIFFMQKYWSSTYVLPNSRSFQQEKLPWREN